MGWKISSKDVFRTKLNIYDGAFLRNCLKAKIRNIFPQKCFIIGVLPGRKYPLPNKKFNTELGLS